MKKAMSITLLSAVVIATLTLNHEVAEANYSDISSTHWASNAIQELADLELVQGFPDGTFRPNQTVTEAEFVAMLIRTLPEEVREKRPEEKWSDPYYEHAQLKHFPLNYADAQTRNRGIKRVAVAELIAHSHGNNFQGNRAIQYLLDEGLAKGKRPNDNSISSYDGQGTLTRAEAVTFIQRLLSYDPDQDQEQVPGKPKSHLELYGDRDIAAEELYKRTKDFGESLGFPHYNSSSTIMFRAPELNELTFTYLGTGFTNYLNDFRIFSSNFENNENKQLFEYIITQYGFPYVDELMNELENLPTYTPETSESMRLEYEGYFLTVQKMYIAEDDRTTMRVRFSIPD